MNAHVPADLRWAQSSSTPADRKDTSDLTLLGAHYRHCNGCTGRWFSIRCAVDALHAFVAPRFMTTVVLIVAVAGAGALVL